MIYKPNKYLQTIRVYLHALYTIYRVCSEHRKITAQVSLTNLQQVGIFTVLHANTTQEPADRTFNLLYLLFIYKAFS